MDKLFKLKENNTSVRTEVVAGITTFMTMAYILAVNPSILSASGMDSNAILMATAIASAIGCFAMAFLANYPFALAPGLGLNAYFAYTVCGSMGYSWKVALFAVFVEGLVFIVLSLTNVREAIFNAIPTTLKKGVSVGIGLFVAFIGLQGANLVVASESTKVTVVNFRTNFNTVGIGALLAVIGTFIIAILYVKHVKGSILIGIVATWVLGIICQLTGLYKVDAAAGFYSLIPSWRSFDVTAISLTFGQCFNLKGLNINILDFIVIMCSFLFVDMFDTLGTLIGVANKAKMLDENGRLPRIKQALLADAIATSAGAILGTSTTTTFVENKKGDVLIAWENEALTSLASYPDEYEIVTPSVSILAQPSVAVVDDNVKVNKTEELASEYLSFLYSKQAQRIAADYGYRPTDEEVLNEYSGKFNLTIKLDTIADYGGWTQAYKIYFDDGGWFDEIYNN